VEKGIKFLAFYYSGFNPTIVRLAVNNRMSIYDVSSTGFGLYLAILREVSNK